MTQGAQGEATNLTAAACRRIEAMIVMLELEPGSVVSEAILGKRLGIGTTPIREALQRLAREHLVRVLPRRGVVVAAIDVPQQLQILETRRELDRLIARMAAKRGTAGQHRALSDLAKRMQVAIDGGDVRGVLRFDGEMNAILAQASPSARPSPHRR